MSSTDPTRSSWIRILHLGGESWLGLVGDDLFVGDETTPKRLLEPEVPTGLLPCLERPYEDVRADLDEREDELSLPRGSLTEMVPLTAIPAAAITSRIDYWVELALDWIVVLPTGGVDDGSLLAIEQAPWASQRAKHRARSIRRGRTT